MAEETKKKRVNYANASQEAKGLMWTHRSTMGIGLLIMMVNRAAGFVLPLSPKVLGDVVIGQHRPDLLVPLSILAGAAVLVQAVSSFGLSQIVSVAAQKAIATMRSEVQSHVIRLPVGYFDS